MIYFRLDCDSGLCGYCLQLLSTSTVCSNQYVLVFFPFALISSFNLLPSLHYLIVIAVRLSDDIDNAHYATLTCSATAGNQIFHFHFPIPFLLIIAVLPLLSHSHPSIHLSESACVQSDSIPHTGEPGIIKYRADSAS